MLRSHFIAPVTTKKTSALKNTITYSYMINIQTMFFCKIRKIYRFFDRKQHLYCSRFKTTPFKWGKHMSFEEAITFRAISVYGTPSGSNSSNSVTLNTEKSGSTRLTLTSFHLRIVQQLHTILLPAKHNIRNCTYVCNCCCNLTNISL